MDIKYTDLIFHKRNFLSKEVCDYLINESNARYEEYQLEHCHEATTFVDTFSSYQKVILKPGTESYRIVHDATEAMINEYHDFLDTFNAFHVGYRGCLLYSHQYRLLKYETGAKIHMHSDHDPYVYGSCTFNLNTGYTGGDFRFFRGKHTVSLGLGDALIFPADFFWVHEVTEITSGPRYSTNSFLQSTPEWVKDRLTECYNKIDVTPPTDPDHIQQLTEGVYKVRGWNKNF